MHKTIYVTTPEPAAKRGVRLIGLGLGSLFLITVILFTLPAKKVEEEIGEALGCRSPASLIILEVQRDGTVLFPDGETYTIEEAAIKLPAWCTKVEEPALAIKADSDTLMTAIKPLLDAASDLGLRQVVFSATGQGPVKFYRR